MAKTGVKIEGMAELEKKLKRLEQSMAGEIRQKALAEVGEFVRQDAHDKCAVKGGVSADGFYVSPGEPTARSGAVRRSIKYEVNVDHVKVGTNHMIAPDLEYGTSRETPKPFLRRSIDDPNTRREIGNKYSDVAKKGIEGAAK